MLFSIVIIYYLIAFTLITILKGDEGKNIYIYIEQDTKTKDKGQRCGTHNGARLQIKCALTENTQILTM